MERLKVYGFEMARISEVYLSTLSAIMTPQGLERYFFPLLHLCEHSGKLTQKDLAETLRRDNVHIMRIVDYLCDKNLVVRKQNPNDRRCQLLYVTKKARTLVPKIKSGIAKTNSMLFHDFSTAEKEQFKTSITKLFATISALPDSAYVLKAFKRKSK